MRSLHSWTVFSIISKRQRESSEVWNKTYIWVSTSCSALNQASPHRHLMPHSHFSRVTVVHFSAVSHSTLLAIYNPYLTCHFTQEALGARQNGLLKQNSGRISGTSHEKKNLLSFINGCPLPPYLPFKSCTLTVLYNSFKWLKNIWNIFKRARFYP